MVARCSNCFPGYRGNLIASCQFVADGLERVAEVLGFATQAEGSPTVSSPLPDYLFPGITSEGLATAIAGILGTLLVFAVLYAVGKALAYSEKTNDG